MSRRSNNYRRKTLAKLFVSMQERKKIATVSRVFVRENKQFSTVFCMEIITDYSLTFCKVSRWFPVTRSTWIGHELTERSLFLNRDAQVSPLLAKVPNICGMYSVHFCPKAKRQNVSSHCVVAFLEQLMVTLLLVSAPPTSLSRLYAI